MVTFVLLVCTLNLSIHQERAKQKDFVDHPVLLFFYLAVGSYSHNYGGEYYGYVSTSCNE
jgi:hypothetical protein